MHVRRNDQVIVVRGAHRGERGKVLRVEPGRGRVLVEGVNFVTKHVRRSAEAPQGGRIEREAPLSAANVAVYCSSCGRGVRTRHSGTGTEKRRTCVKCGNPVGATK
jgi:large subunit ribosomal protein L24